MPVANLRATSVQTSRSFHPIRQLSWLKTTTSNSRPGSLPRTWTYPETPLARGEPICEKKVFQIIRNIEKVFSIPFYIYIYIYRGFIRMGRDGIRIQKSCPSSAGDCLNRVVASRAQITQMTQMVQWIVNLAPLKCKNKNKKKGGWWSLAIFFC